MKHCFFFLSKEFPFHLCLWSHHHYTPQWNWHWFGPHTHNCFYFAAAPRFVKRFESRTATQLQLIRYFENVIIIHISIYFCSARACMQWAGGHANRQPDVIDLNRFINRSYSLHCYQLPTFKIQLNFFFHSFKFSLHFCVKSNLLKKITTKSLLVSNRQSWARVKAFPLCVRARAFDEEERIMPNSTQMETFVNVTPNNIRFMESDVCEVTLEEGNARMKCA